MDSSCSRERKKCLMWFEASISVVLLSASMYMFVMVGYFTSTNRRILSLIFGVLGGLILLGGVITLFYFVAIWRDLKQNDAQTTENPARRVRFSSLLEIHETVEQTSDNADHEYEEIFPPECNGGMPVAKRQNHISISTMDKSLNGNQNGSKVSQPHDLSIEDEQYVNNKTVYYIKYKEYLESGNNYGTFEGSYSNYFEGGIEESENYEGEEIII